MNSSVSIGRWLLVGILSITALLGCENKEEKAKDQANKANAYINEQNQLRKGLLTDHNILVPKDEILTQGKLYANMAAGQYINYFPSCIETNSRTDIKNKLARVVVLSEEIQKIMANEEVRYGGPASDFEHVKQNARLMLTELDKNPDCGTTVTADNKPSDERIPGADPFPNPAAGDETDQDYVNRLVVEIQETRDELESNYGVKFPIDESLTTDQIQSDYMPECYADFSAKAGILSKLTVIYANATIVEAKVLSGDAQYGGDDDDIANLKNNVSNLLSVAEQLPMCGE